MAVAQTPVQRARSMAEQLRELARACDCAAAGRPERLYRRRNRGFVDTGLACLERDFRNAEADEPDH